MPFNSNLIVTASQPMSKEDLKKKLIEQCQQRDLPYWNPSMEMRLGPCEAGIVRGWLDRVHGYGGCDGDTRERSSQPAPDLRGVIGRPPGVIGLTPGFFFSDAAEPPHFKLSTEASPQAADIPACGDHWEFRCCCSYPPAWS